MSSMNVRPHLVVEYTDKGLEESDLAEATWYEMRDYHIASSEKSENDMFIGQQISEFLQAIEINKGRWFRIRYYEEISLSTTAGGMALPGKSLVVSQVCRKGGDIETFYDKNSDGYWELNQSFPYYEQFPRTASEEEMAAGTGAEPGEKGRPGELKIGDYVEVADPAYCNEEGGNPKGYVDDTFFGEVCKVVATKDTMGNVRVEHPDGSTNVILPEYLTKVKKDGSPIEEDDEDFKAGEDVEGEDEAEKVYLKDGDVITVHDEYGHEKQIQIVVT